MSKPVIVLNELTKSYGKHRGIENISFTVEQGEVSQRMWGIFPAKTVTTTI